MKKIAYCTGFWCTNIGNAFFSLGVEYVLKQVLGNENITLVSDYQTYTDNIGNRLYPSKNQLEYISLLDVDYIVLAGPVLSKYFMKLWKDILIQLEQRGVRWILLSAGMMKMTDSALEECLCFFKKHPPYILMSRDIITFETFGKYADHAYNGICFSFFAPDYYIPCKILGEKFIALNFDKISEPEIIPDASGDLSINDNHFRIRETGILTKVAKKTDRFSDALIYLQSAFPQRTRKNQIDEYKIIRTDHRFHPHYRRKIYAQDNSFCADLPYGYLNLYANAELTLSDRIHACAVTMAYGHSAMLFAKTDRVGLLDRVGAGDIIKSPVKLDLSQLEQEKTAMITWLTEALS